MITVYTKNNCIQCKMTKQLMNQLEIKYMEINIENNNKIRERLISLGMKGAPVVYTGSEYFYGFQPDKIRRLG